MNDYRIREFPKSRIASVDVYETGRRKHHVVALIEVDVTDSREKIKRYRKEVGRISFTGWLIKAISITIKNNDSVAAFLKGKRRLMIFNDINVSVMVEKEINGQKVPLPLVIKNADNKSIESITKELDTARKQVLSEKDIVLQSGSTPLERLYYFLPGIIRRYIWRYLLRHPNLVFKKMGNVAVTSIGMVGNISGWFIPTSVHPLCFGISSIVKKPGVVNDKIEIRQMLNLTILLDHDVIDGAPMARFIKELTGNLGNGIAL